MPKEKERVIHRAKKGLATLEVSKIVEEEAQIVDAPDITVKPPTPISKREKRDIEKPKKVPAKVDIPKVHVPEEHEEIPSRYVQMVDLNYVWLCPVCKNGFDSHRVLAEHIQKEHGIDPKHVLFQLVETKFYRWLGEE